MRPAQWQYQSRAEGLPELTVATTGSWHPVTNVRVPQRRRNVSPDYLFFTADVPVDIAVVQGITNFAFRRKTRYSPPAYFGPDFFDIDPSQTLDWHSEPVQVNRAKVTRSKVPSYFGPELFESEILDWHSEPVQVNRSKVNRNKDPQYFGPGFFDIDPSQTLDWYSEQVQVNRHRTSRSKVPAYFGPDFFDIDPSNILDWYEPLSKPIIRLVSRRNTYTFEAVGDFTPPADNAALSWWKQVTDPVRRKLRSAPSQVFAPVGDADVVPDVFGWMVQFPTPVFKRKGITSGFFEFTGGSEVEYKQPELFRTGPKRKGIVHGSSYFFTPDAHVLPDSWQPVVADILRKGRAGRLPKTSLFHVETYTPPPENGWFTLPALVGKRRPTALNVGGMSPIDFIGFVAGTPVNVTLEKELMFVTDLSTNITFVVDMSNDLSF